MTLEALQSLLTALGNCQPLPKDITDAILVEIQNLRGRGLKEPAEVLEEFLSGLAKP